MSGASRAGARLACRLARLLILALVLALPEAVRAETSGHERTGVEREESAELSFGQSLAVSADGAGGYSFDAAASLELWLRRSFFVGICLPARAVLRDGAAGPAAAAGLGDPSLSAGLSFRAGDARLSLEAGYSEPLGISEAHEAAARGIATGSGERSLDLAGGATLFADPLALSLRFAASLSLPRPSAPGIGLRGLALSLGATEALNAEFAYSLGLSQRLAFRSRRAAAPGAPPQALPDYSASLSFSVLRSLGRAQLRLSVAKELSDASAPEVGLGFGYRFPLGGKADRP